MPQTGPPAWVDPAGSGGHCPGLPGLNIGGLTPLSSLDFPGELTAVVFCQGCPWRCRYCHNSALLPTKGPVAVPWRDIESLLARRRGLLDAVVFSGGEPTLQRGLATAMERVKTAGFKVGLHTAGCYPNRLPPLMPLLDWVGLDVKALPEDYGSITGAPDSGARGWASLEVLLGLGASLEVRTTLLPGWTLAGEVAPLMRRLAAAGVARYAVQSCRTEHSLDRDLLDAGTSAPTRSALHDLGTRLFRHFLLR
jgi:pyruvate formate lyase activating enzyme